MPPVARVAHFSLDPAIGAEPVVRVPMQERTRLGQDGQFALRQRSCRGKAAQVHQAFLRLHRACKPAAAPGIDAEEHAFRRARRLEGLQFSVPDEGFIAAHVDVPGRRLDEQAREPDLIGSVVGAAVEGISEEGESG
jgi:hypothetical protein